MKCCGADLNHNLWLNLVIAALMGFSESIWTNTIGVAFIYDVWGGSNTKVGLATALTGVAAMLTAFLELLGSACCCCCCCILETFTSTTFVLRWRPDRNRCSQLRLLVAAIYR